MTYPLGYSLSISLSLSLRETVISCFILFCFWSRIRIYYYSDGCCKFFSLNLKMVVKSCETFYYHSFLWSKKTIAMLEEVCSLYQQ